MGRPCPEVSNNIKHLYVCLMLLENFFLLTLFMGVGLKWPQILTLYMLGLKGLVLEIPKMYHMLM